jgi:hypothetical protein
MYLGIEVACMAEVLRCAEAVGARLHRLPEPAQNPLQEYQSLCPMLQRQPPRCSAEPGNASQFQGQP